MWTALRRGRTCWAGNPRSMTSILSCLSCCWCSCSLWLNSFISKGGATYELHNTRLFQCFLHVQVLRQVLLRACHAGYCLAVCAREQDSSRGSKAYNTCRQLQLHGTLQPKHCLRIIQEA